MNKKRIIIIIALCLCTVTVIGILIKVVYNSEMTKNIRGRTANNQLLLSGIGVFSEKYTGFLETKNITNRVQNLTKQDIPELYDDIKYLNESKLKKYYAENLGDIQNIFGIQTTDEFMNFVTSLKAVKTNLDTWYKLNLKRDTFVNESEKKGYAYVEYDVIFENEEKLRFSLYVSKRESLTPTYIVGIK